MANYNTMQGVLRKLDKWESEKALTIKLGKIFEAMVEKQIQHVFGGVELQPKYIGEPTWEDLLERYNRYTPKRWDEIYPNDGSYTRPKHDACCCGRCSNVILTCGV